MNDLVKKSFIENISEGENPYIIAEIGINHNGNMDLAREMIDAAAENGADCVKFQNFIADKYISTHAEKAEYQKKNKLEKRSQHEIIKACEITITQAKDLQSYSKKKNIDFLSTPFELWSLSGLISIEVPAIKISSCNLTNIPFLEEAAKSKLPILLSSGMGTLNEVINAVSIFKKTNSPLMIFQCTSNYPSDPKNANLNVMKIYKKLFNIPVGLSDHTTSNTTSIAAVALGAIAIEKHFTLSRDLPGIDQKASMEPNELNILVKQLKECKAALGSHIKHRTKEEESSALALRRSLIAATDLKVGELVKKDHIKIMRPGNGLMPEQLQIIIGKRLTRSVKKGVPFSFDDFLSL